MRRLRTLVIHASSARTTTLSYQHGWPRALAAGRAFDVDLVNLNGRHRGAGDVFGLGFRHYDAVVLLHSVFSNERFVSPELAHRIRRSRAVRVLFLGNEYKLMPEKMAFAEEIGVNLLVSQLEGADALELYRRSLGCEVIGLPNTGLDPEMFRPVDPFGQRPIEIGYRAHESPWYLGHRERRLLAEVFTAAAPRLGLRIDVSLNAADRLDEPGWAAFLNRCVGQLGSEAGGDYFELDDRTRGAVNAFLAARPDASFDDVFDRFFRGYLNPVSGRCISSRIIEAAGTGTAQLLIEGHYSGYLQPDVHYIPLRNDLTNVDEAIEKLRDEATRTRIVEHAYSVAMTEFSYERLLGRFQRALLNTFDDR